MKQTPHRIAACLAALIASVLIPLHQGCADQPTPTPTPAPTTDGGSEGSAGKEAPQPSEGSEPAPPPSEGS